jgi:hypothetical protein
MVGSNRLRRHILNRQTAIARHETPEWRRGVQWVWWKAQANSFANGLPSGRLSVTPIESVGAQPHHRCVAGFQADKSPADGKASSAIDEDE